MSFTHIRSIDDADEFWAIWKIHFHSHLDICVPPLPEGSEKMLRPKGIIQLYAATHAAILSKCINRSIQNNLDTIDFDWFDAVVDNYMESYYHIFDSNIRDFFVLIRDRNVDISFPTILKSFIRKYMDHFGENQRICTAPLPLEMLDDLMQVIIGKTWNVIIDNAKLPGTVGAAAEPPHTRFAGGALYRLILNRSYG